MYGHMAINTELNTELGADRIYYRHHWHILGLKRFSVSQPIPWSRDLRRIHGSLGFHVNQEVTGTWHPWHAWHS